MEHCKGCSKTFKYKKTLQRHLATTACGKSEIQDLECDYCTYTTPHKHNLARHASLCKYAYAAEQSAEAEQEKEALAEKTRELLKAKDLKIETLQREKEALRKRVKDLKAENLEFRLQLQEDKGQLKVYKERPVPTVNTTNYINPKLLQVKCDTIRPFTIKTVREDIQAGKFTFELFIQAEKGILEFVADIIAKDAELSYVCTDMSRQKFHRLVESREWKDDNGASFLNKVLDELKEPATEYYNRICDMMVNGDRDTADFLREKTKTMVMGITSPKSKDRDITFAKVRNEVKKLSTI